MRENRTSPQDYLNYLFYLGLYSGSYGLYVFVHHAVKFPLSLLCNVATRELGIWFGSVCSEMKGTSLRQLKQ